MAKIHKRDYFFKYVTADIAQLILENLQVKCSSPKLFNDPFDSQLPVNLDQDIDDEGFFENLSQKLCNLILNSSTSGSRQVNPIIKPIVDASQGLQVKDLLKALQPCKNIIIQEWRKAFDKFNTFCRQLWGDDRIFCVCEEHDNLLMWAHYTNSHQGAVIKFRCIPELDTALCAAEKVMYSKEMPVLATLDDFVKTFICNESLDPHTILNKFNFTKSDHWSYEKEWRIILKKQNSGTDYDLRYLHEEELEGIYLGCKMRQESKQEILNLINTKRKKVKIFQANKHSRLFKLDFEQVK